MCATHRLVVGSPFSLAYLASLSSTRIISSVSLLLLLYGLSGTAAATEIYIHICIFPSLFLLSLLARPAPRLFLSFIFIHHRLSTRPSTSVLSSSLGRCHTYIYTAALRGERPRLFVRFTLNRSYFLSRLSAVTPSSVVSAARSRFCLSPSRTHARTHASVSSVPFASFSNFRRQCCTAAASAEGRDQKHAARPC